MKRSHALVALAALGLAAAAACSSDPAPARPALTRDEMLDPATCKTCHADHYREWSGSMHAYAADDPVFLAMNARGQRETNGALGDFCVKCHAPMALIEGATKDGQNLAAVPAKLKGVTCLFCHSVERVDGTHNAQLTVARDAVIRGNFADPVPGTPHRSAYSPLHDRDKLESASMCGACHDIVNGHGVALERTFAEWKASVFSKAPGGATCGQCHMSQSAALTPVAQTVEGVAARRRHSHTFAGVDVALTPFPEAEAQKREIQAFLDASLQSALCVSTAGGTRVRVLLDNVAGGHGFPSGAVQDRRVWVEVAAYAGGSTIYQSGVTDASTPIAKTSDPDVWLMRECLFDAKGAEVHMFWEGTSTDGNALPAQVTYDPTDPRFYQTHIERVFPRAAPAPGAADRVTMRVRIEPIGRDVLDDLVATKDLDPAVVRAMPTFDVGASLEWTAAGAATDVVIDRLPYRCVTKTNFNVQADRFPAKERTRCKP